jgi:hypothetical protein
MARVRDVLAFSFGNEKNKERKTNPSPILALFYSTKLEFARTYRSLNHVLIHGGARGRRGKIGKKKILNCDNAVQVLL